MPRVRPRGLLRARSPSLLPSAGAAQAKESILEGGEGFERSRDASRARAWPCRGGDPCEKTRASVLRVASYSQVARIRTRRCSSGEQNDWSIHTYGLALSAPKTADVRLSGTQIIPVPLVCESAWRSRGLRSMKQYEI